MNTQFLSNEFYLEINEMGAYIEKLEYKKTQIIFPKTEIISGDTKKIRGGNHLCLPHFGGNERLGLPRHGFARLEKWTLVNKDENSITYELKTSNETYKDMKSILTFTFDSGKMSTILKLENNNSNSLEVSPGFHPYYFVNDYKDFKINGENIPYNDQELERSQEFGDVSNFETDKFFITQTSNNLSKCVVWSDKSAPFICVEPAFNYQGGLKDTPFVLEANSKAEFSYTIEIELK